MDGQRLKQADFSNGEISPDAYGLTKDPRFANSLAVCCNWFPAPNGGLVKRSGTRDIAAVKDQTYDPILVPFVFSDQQSFVLEFGDLYVRVYRLGVLAGELITPFTKAMLPYLTYEQVGDVITLTCGGYGVGSPHPQDLKHVSGAVWPWTIGDTPTKIPNGVVAWLTGPVDGVAAWSNAVTYQLGYPVSLANVEWTSIQKDNLNNTPPAVPAVNTAGTGLAGNFFWTPSTDAVNQAQGWEWVETIVVQDAQGVVYESAQSPTLSVDAALGPNRTRPIIRATYNLAAGYTALYMRVYRRSKNGNFGWIFDHEFTTPFTDDGRAPDYTKQPPQGTDPFLVNGAPSYPSVVSYLDQRRLWGGSAAIPSMYLLSKASDLYNYDTRLVPGADTDAMQVLLASHKLEQIRHVVQFQRTLIFTAQGEWVELGSPLKRGSANPKRMTGWGCSWVRPVEIGGGLIFNTAKSNMVRDFFPTTIYLDHWDGQDLTEMARHLFNLFTEQAATFQSVPYPIRWSVRNDGTLLSLTYRRPTGDDNRPKMFAWARHTTGVGDDAFTAICCVPEPPEDAVYVVVKRLVNGVVTRRIERFHSIVCPASPYEPGVSDVRYGTYLDAAKLYDGHNDQLGLGLVGATFDSTGFPGSRILTDYAANQLVTISLIMLPGTGPFTVNDADANYGSNFVFDPEGALGFGPVTAKITQYLGSESVVAELSKDLTLAQLEACGTPYGARTDVWAIAKGQITAAHLAGYQLDTFDANDERGILCLVDGDPQVPQVWAAGVASLKNPGIVIQCGISFNADVQQLDAWDPRGEIRNLFKNVYRLGFEVSGSRDLWFGPSFDSLVQWDQRKVVDAYNTLGLESGYFEDYVTGDWGKSGKACLRHFLPLPANLSSILREMSLGGS